MNRILLIIAAASTLILGACGGEEPEETGTASLVVKVTHVDGSNVFDATVELYESQLDYQNHTNSIASLKTDNLGEAYFTDLKLKQYWFTAEFDGYSNSNSVFTTGRVLNKDERMEKTTQIRK
jgi:hypothetical protein